MSFNYGNYGGVSTYGYPYGNIRPQNAEREYPDLVFRMPEKKDNNTTAKVVGTAAAIAAAIYLIKTGKAGKAMEFVKNKNPLKNLNITAIKDRANTAFQKVKDKVTPAKINEQAGKLKDKAGEFIKDLKKDINTEKINEQLNKFKNSATEITEKVKTKFKPENLNENLGKLKDNLSKYLEKIQNKVSGKNTENIFKKSVPTAKQAEALQRNLTRSKKAAEVASAFAAKGSEKVTFKQIQAAYDAAGKKMPRLSDKLKWAEKLALWQDMLRTNSPKLKDIV